MSRSFHTTLIVLLLVTKSLAQTKETAKESPGEGELRIEKRAYKTWPGEEGEYEIGTLFVRENRGDPNSRLIGINFSRFKAKEPSGAPPIFFLPGGPGNTYQEPNDDDPQLRKTPFYGEYLWSHCDVITVDQRGYCRRGETLRAAYIGRQPKPAAALEDRVEEFRRFARSTVQRYDKTETDLRGYTVLECVEDVNELRKALGYEQISLRGQSFGCQWSFAVMRKHPEIVKRALLSGIEPLDHTYDMPSDIFAAVKRIWKVIDQDERFKPYLPPGGMVEAAETVIKQLEESPIELEKKGLFGFGKLQIVRALGPDDFPWDEPAQILELYHGKTERWANARPRMGGLNALIWPLIDSSLGVTPERRDKLWNDPAVRYLSRSNFANLLATADIWPSPDVGDEFRRPVKCEVPVVFVNGDWDRNTPIENMHEIAPYFPNSHSLTVHQAGHGTINNALMQQHPKVFRQLMEFLRTGNKDGLPNRIEVKPYKTFNPPAFELPKKGKGKTRIETQTKSK